MTRHRNLPRAVEVSAPATIANMGAGFDILGLALSDPSDTLYAERSATPGVEIVEISGDGGRLSREAARNTAGIAAQFVLNQIGAKEGVRLRLHKGLPLESGLGSSAASAVAGAVAVNALFGNPLSRRELLPACVEGEAAVSGRHADNVAPALFGGLVLVTGTTPDTVYPLPVPAGLVLALVTPAVRVPTAAARAVLPTEIALKTYVQQSASVGLLLHAIHSNDLRLMAIAMAGDLIVEPAREHLMPALREVRQAAALAGALCTVISGAGPTLCAVCDSVEIAETVTQNMASVYNSHKIACTTYVTTPALHGATLKEIQD